MIADLQAIADADGDGWAADRPGDDAVLTGLAALAPMDYDRVRRDEADRLGVRADTLDRLVARLRVGTQPATGGGEALALDEVEPWPAAADGAAMLNAFVDRLRRHIVLPAGAADALALWIVHAHCHDAAAISPILAITSPTPECGKTTALSALTAVVPRALPGSNITAAALFRAVEKWRPTLLIDEADTFLRDNDELRGVLNSGHNRATAWVIRTAGEKHEPRRFATWAPAAIALIGSLPATLASRSIHVELRRLGEGETIEPLRGQARDHLLVLGRLAARWAADHVDELRNAEPAMPVTLRGRTADNWRALLAIADVVGGAWPARARAAAETLSAGKSESTAAVMLLDDIRTIFAGRQIDRLLSTEIVSALAAQEDRPWPEWRNGKPITARQLAQLLTPFGISPTTVRTSATIAKGYHLDAFADAFGRYLPSSRNTVTTAEVRHSGATTSVTPKKLATDDIGPKPAESSQRNGVTAGDPVTAGERLSEDDRAWLDEVAM